MRFWRESGTAHDASQICARRDRARLRLAASRRRGKMQANYNAFVLIPRQIEYSLFFKDYAANVGTYILIVDMEDDFINLRGGKN